MVTFVRRHAWQFVGAVLVAVVLTGLAIVAFRPQRSTQATMAAHTAGFGVGPRSDADRIQATAVDLLKAITVSEKTGDATPVDQFLVPRSPAVWIAGDGAAASHDEQRNFMVSRVDFIESGWHIDVSGPHATAAMAFRVTGHDATWPSLKPLNTDREMPVRTIKLSLQHMGGRWLVDDISG